MKKIATLGTLLYSSFAMLSPQIAHAYECKIDLNRHYVNASLYINRNGEAYSMLNYSDGRFDTMEYVYDLKNCQYISNGVKSKSNVKTLLEQKGFRQVNTDSTPNLSPWLSHYFTVDIQNNRFIAQIDPVNESAYQGLTELYAYARDKNTTLSANANALFQSKYSQTTEFYHAIVQPFFRSVNFANFAATIESSLLSSPERVKNHLAQLFLQHEKFKLNAKEERNKFVITFQPESKNIKISKVATVTVPFECKTSRVENYTQKETEPSGKIWEKKYAKDKTVCSVWGSQKSDVFVSRYKNAAEAAGLAYAYNVRSVGESGLGTDTDRVLLSSRVIGVDQKQAAKYEREQEILQIQKRQCLSNRKMCLSQCEGGLRDSYEKWKCERTCMEMCDVF